MSRNRSRTRQWAKIAAVLFVFVLGTAAFLPLPVAWILRAVARQHLDSTEFDFRVHRATFRWQWGKPAVRLALSEAQLSYRGVDVFKAGRMEVLAPKNALWADQVDFVDATFDQVVVTIDLRVPSSTSAGEGFVPSDVRSLFQALQPPSFPSERLLASLTDVRIDVVDLQDSATYAAARSSFGWSRDLQGVSINLDWTGLEHGTPAVPAGEGRVRAHVGANETRVNVTSSSLNFTRPGYADVAVSSFTVEGGLRREPGEIWLRTVHPIDFSGGALASFDLFGSVQDEFSLRWSTEATGVSGEAVSPLLGSGGINLSASQTALLRVDRFSTDGEVRLGAQATSWKPLTLSARAGLDLALGAEEIVTTLELIKEEGGQPVLGTLRVEPFGLAGASGLWPATWPVPDANLRISGEGELRIAPSGVPEFANIRMRSSEPGVLSLPWPEAPKISLSSFESSAAWSSDPTHGVTAELKIVSSAGSGFLQVKGVTQSADGWIGSGRLEAERVPGSLLPADLGDQLEASTGLIAGDLSLARFSASWDHSSARPLEQSQAEGAGELMVGGERIPFVVGANYTTQNEFVGLKVGLGPLVPARLPWLGDAAALKRMELPVSLGVDVWTNLKEGRQGWRGFTLNGGSGAFLGPVTDPWSVPVGSIRLALEANETGDEIRMAEARADLGGTDLSVQLIDSIAHQSSEGWMLSGRAFLSGGTWKSVREAWPHDRQPAEIRTRLAMLESAEVLPASIEFDVGFDPSADEQVRIRKLEGPINLRDIMLSSVPVIGSVGAPEMMLRLGVPETLVEAPTIHIGPDSVASLSATIGGITSDEIALDARFAADLRVHTLVTVPPGELSASAAALRGDLNVEGRVTTQLSLSSGEMGAQAEIRARSESLVYSNELQGPWSASIEAALTPAGRLSVDSVVDVSRIVLHSSGTVFGLETPVPVRIVGAVTLSDEPSIDFQVEGEKVLGQPLLARGSIGLGRGVASTDLVLGDGRWGATSWTGASLKQIGNDHESSVHFNRIDLPQLWKVVEPRWDWLKQRGTTDEGLNAPAGAGAFTSKVSADVITWGKEFSTEDFSFSIEQKKEELFSLDVSLDDDGDGRNLTLRVGSALRSPVALRVGDAGRWLRVFSGLFTEAPSSHPDFKDITEGLMQATTLIGGGDLVFEGTWDRSLPAPRVIGTVNLKNARVLEPPRLLRLLALKSERSFENDPLVRELSIGKLEWSPAAVEVSNLRMEGRGLVDRIIVNRGVYSFETAAIDVDGSFWGVGIEIAGTRESPSIYLKENLLIRAVGSDAAADFDL